MSLKRFWWRRLLRISPAFYTMLAVDVFIFRDRAAPSEIWTTALYVSNWAIALDAARDFGNLGPTWSLAVEEHFYLVWPLVLSRLKEPRRALPALMGLVVAVQLYRIWLVAGGHSQYAYFATDARIDAILLGCALAIYSDAAEVPRWLLSRAAVLFTAVGFAAISTWQVLTPIHTAAGLSLAAWLSAMFLPQAIERRWRWLNTRWMDYLGRLSYSMYLYHYPVYEMTRVALAGTHPFILIAIILASTTACSAISYHFIELPFLRLRDRVGTGESSSRAAASVQREPIPSGRTGLSRT